MNVITVEGYDPKLCSPTEISSRGRDELELLYDYDLYVGYLGGIWKKELR